LVLQVAGLPTEVIVRLPPAVREFTLRPLISSLKSPFARLGVKPAIKLFVAGIQVGVSGRLPFSFVVVITSAAWAVPAKASKTVKISLAAAFQDGLCGWLMIVDRVLRLKCAEVS
jgi:hypothetical protein